MRQQLQLFFNAWVFFTRLPGPKWVSYDQQHLSQSSRYFPWIGMVLGIIQALLFSLLVLFLPVAIAVLCCLAASLWLTGAFHEDGLADTFDGLGGGWDRERMLSIMKDSRLGTYGAAALFISLLIRWQLMVWVLDQRDWLSVLLVFVLSESLSRFVAISLLWTLEYVADPEHSKSKPLATQFGLQSSLTASIPIVIVIALAVLGQRLSWLQLGIMAVLSIVVRWQMVCTLKRNIGGYTGDTLGATQQLAVIAAWIGFGVNG